MIRSIRSMTLQYRAHESSKVYADFGWAVGCHGLPESLLKPSESWTGSGQPVSVKSGMRGEHATEIAEAIHDI